MILENEERGAEDQVRRIKRRRIFGLGYGKGEKEQSVQASNIRDKAVQPHILCIPNDVLYCVLDKLLELVDYVRFAAVCKELQIVAEHYNLCRQRWLRKPHLLPMLMLPPNESDNDSSSSSSEPQMKQRLVYSVSERKLYNNINIGLYNEKFCGSSHGWLASTLKSSEDWPEEYTLKVTYEITLRNPFGKSSEVIHLPHYIHCHRHRIVSHRIHLDGWIPRVMLSANPALYPENYYVLFVLYRPMPNRIAQSELDYSPPLAILKGGQESWITTPRILTSLKFDDAIFYKNKVCLLVDLSRHWLVTIDVTTNERKFYDFDPAPTFWAHYWERYLVESTNGDLLLVFRFFLPKGTSFAVCKFVFDEEDDTRVQLVDVKCIGDDAIFLGQNQSQSVLASRIPGCKPNCIYYATESIRRVEYPNYCDRKYIRSDMGIFNLGDMTTTTLLDSDSRNNWNWNKMNMPFWILPSLNVSLDL